MICFCDKCKNFFKYDETDCFWDESGYGYSVKLIKCTECGGFHVIKVIEDKGLDVNGDERFYEY